jgi:cobalt-zinc-cadmium efflux system outer membrane protein
LPRRPVFADAQLLPVTAVSFDNQAGPPQYDLLLTVPVDWCLFGKRVAARAAARLGVGAAQAEFADQHRREVAATVGAFYDALEADIAVRLAEQGVIALGTLGQTARAAGKAGVEARRVQLTVLDVRWEARKRRAAAETTKAKLQARIGRPPDAPDFVVRGALAVRATAPALTVAQAWALAERHRPDLEAARRAVPATDAAAVRERRRGLPQPAVTTGPDYQDQQRITGFRNAALWTVAVSGTLPTTDRNQGRVLAAEAAARASRAALGAAVADARAEVEQAVAEYAEAVSG